MKLEAIMRFLLQMATMLGDLAILAAVGILGYNGVNLWVCAIVLVIAHRITPGGLFFAWRPSNIRAFMRNAKIARL